MPSPSMLSPLTRAKKVEAGFLTTSLLMSRAVPGMSSAGEGKPAWMDSKSLISVGQELVHLDDEALVGAVRYLALGVPGGHVEDQTAAVDLLECGCCGDGLSDRGCLDVGDVNPGAYGRQTLFEQPVDRIAGGHLHVGHYGRCREYVQCARTHEGGAVLLADLGGRCRGNSYFDIFCCHIYLN